jgi:hypothetical protein
VDEFCRGYHGVVLDVLFVGIPVAFFVLAAAYVRACVRLAASAESETRR